MKMENTVSSLFHDHPATDLLFRGVATGDTGLITVALAAKADITATSRIGHSLLMVAGTYRQPASIYSLLLEQGAPVDVTDLFGNTAGHFVGKAHPEYAAITALLLAYDADMAAKNMKGDATIDFCKAALGKKHPLYKIMKAKTSPSRKPARMSAKTKKKNRKKTP